MQLHCYVGNGTAHRVIKGYIGVNGVAKKIYEPIEYKKITNPAYIDSGVARGYRSNYMTSLVGNYALFTNGYYYGYGNYSYSNSITGINDDTLSKSTYTLSYTSDCKTCSCGTSYALFGNYFYRADSKNVTTYYIVDAFNTSMVRSYAPDLTNSPNNRESSSMKVASIGNYGIFRSGNTCETYNESLVKSTWTSVNSSEPYEDSFELGKGVFTLSSTAANTSYTGIYYNENLVRSTTSYSSVSSVQTPCATTGFHALFGQYAYSTSFVRSQMTVAPDSAAVTNKKPFGNNAIYVNLETNTTGVVNGGSSTINSNLIKETINSYGIYSGSNSWLSSITMPKHFFAVEYTNGYNIYYSLSSMGLYS